jgi:hypothetical protein
MAKTMNQMNALSAKFVRVSLAVLAVLSMLLVPGLGPASGVQAQDPEVGANAITQSVSASVSISPPPYDSVSLVPKTITRTENVVPSIPVKIKCWGPFSINVAVTLSGNVPLTVLYVPSGRQESKTMAMTGNKTEVITPSICVVGPPQVYTLVPTVQASGAIQVTGQTGENYVDVRGNGTLSGSATVLVTGQASLVTNTYLPIIAKPDQSSGGGPWSDDFSTNKGWKNLSPPDDCAVELDNDTMRVTLKKKGKVCWISTPDGVSLSQGTFTVDATRTSDKKGWYGLVFNTTTSLLTQNWIFEVAQWSGSGGCDSDKAKIKLSYVDGTAGNQWTDCTSKVKPNKEDWNRLQVVRSGDTVKASINGSERFNVNESRLTDAGLFDLVVWGEEAGFVVRFDNFDIR